MFAGNERLYLNRYVNQHFVMPVMPPMPVVEMQEQEEPISLVVRESRPSPRPRSSSIEDGIANAAAAAAAVRPLPFHRSYPNISPVFASRLQLPPLPLQLSLPPAPPQPPQSHTLRATEKNFTADEFAKVGCSPKTATNWTCAVRSLVDKQQTPDSSCVSRESGSVSPSESYDSSRTSPSTTHQPSYHRAHQSRHRRKAVSLAEKNTSEYQEKRMRNNIAAKKSRDKRRVEEKMMQVLNAFLKNKLDLLENVTDRCSTCKSRREIEYTKLSKPDYDELLKKFM